MNEDRHNEIARLESYREFVHSPAGEIVFKDLRRRYLYPSLVGVVSHNNPLALAFAAGQRELIMTIENWANTDPVKATAYFEEDDNG